MSVYSKYRPRPVIDISYTVKESEEIRNYRSAFEANPTTAAGRRMREYLRRTNNGSIAAAVSYNGRDGSPGAKLRRQIAFSFYMAKENIMASTRIATAGAALGETMNWLSTHRENLAELVEKAREEYARLTGQISGISEDITEQEKNVAETREAIAQKEIVIAETDNLLRQSETEMMNFGIEAVSLENRAIKIVRPMNSIADFKRLLTQPETEAPEIYVVAGTDPGGALVYDRITRGSDGSTIIERVLAGEAPALLKESDGVYTDMIERVFHRSAADGSLELVRMEHGFNGETMGRIGEISQNMIEFYLRAKGSDIAGITSCATAYEAKMNARNALIEAHYSASDKKRSLARAYEEAADRIEKAHRHIETHKLALTRLHNHAANCCDKIERLEDELTKTDRIVSLANEYNEKIKSGTYTNVEDLLQDMPVALRHEFMRFHGERLIQAPTLSDEVALGVRGPNRMNSAWAMATPATSLAANDTVLPSLVHLSRDGSQHMALS